MNTFTYILSLALTGLLVGGLARLVLPGRESLGMFGTILAGLAGSFIGGLIVTYLVGSTRWLLGLIVAVACAILFILPFRVFVVQPAVAPRRSFWGSRAADSDYAYDRPYRRRPFWSRRRTLL